MPTATPIAKPRPRRPAPQPRPAPVLSTAESAECTCPDFCERDHDRD